MLKIPALFAIFLSVLCCGQPPQAISNEHHDIQQTASTDSLRLIQTCIKILDALKFNHVEEVASCTSPLSLTYFISLDTDSIRQYRLLNARIHPGKNKAMVEVKINDMAIPVVMRFCRQDSTWMFNNLWREGRDWSWKWSGSYQAIATNGTYASEYVRMEAAQVEEDLWNYHCEPKAE